MSGNHSATELVRKAPGYGVKVAERWAVRQYRRLYFRANPDHHALDREAAVEQVRTANSILFLCWGNICRSPFAERYAATRLAERGLDDVDMRSAGLGQVEGRSSPDHAVAAAAERDVDLTDHRSSRATAPLVASSDVVFVMSYNNYHSVSTDFPATDGAVFFLGVLGATETPDRDSDPAAVLIGDPHGSEREMFDAVYATIADAVDEIVAVLDENA